MELTWPDPLLHWTQWWAPYQGHLGRSGEQQHQALDGRVSKQNKQQSWWKGRAKQLMITSQTTLSKEKSTRNNALNTPVGQLETGIFEKKRPKIVRGKKERYKSGTAKRESHVNRRFFNKPFFNKPFFFLLCPSFSLYENLLAKHLHAVILRHGFGQMGSRAH